MPTLGQLGTGTYKNAGAGVGARGGNVLQTWQDPRAAGLMAGMPTDPNERVAYAMANRIDPSQLGLTTQQINYGEQGNMGARWNKQTGQMESTTGQPYMANAGNGGGPIDTGAAGGPMTGIDTGAGPSGAMFSTAPQLGFGVDPNSGLPYGTPPGGPRNPNTGGLPSDATAGGGLASGGGSPMGAYPGAPGATAGGLNGAAGGPATTLGALGVGTPVNPPSVNEAPGNYTGGMSMSDYLNPEAGWARDEGLKALQSSYAGAGNFLSGPAMKGISDYTTKSAINSAYQPAFQNYMQDKGFNYGVDSGDRAFGYQAKLNDQTIPFDQQMRLGQLGLGGTQANAQLMTSLAALLSNNMLTGANAGAAGTIGGSNALTQAISQMISNGSSNRLLNNLNLGG